MLAMKILANRVVEDTDKVESDLKDAVALMKVTKLTTERLLVDLLRECYRWWAYETIRSGLLPTAEEQADLARQSMPAMEL
jgi:hypothetical protein